MEYVELLLQSSHHWLFFSPATAEEKAREIEQAGGRAQIVEENMYWTVFQLN